LAACQSAPAPAPQPIEDENMYIPGVSRTTSTNENQPLRPLSAVGVSGSTGELSAGTPQTCWTDADCTTEFNHCVQDVPSEVGICTRQCASQNDCTATNDRVWLCADGTWGPSDVRMMCLLSCIYNAECPNGTSCNGGFCGTPCSGANCQPREQAACTSHHAVDCSGDAVFWYDACGDIEEVKEICAQGETCVLGQCLGTGGTPSNPPASGSDCRGSHTYRCGSSSQVLEMDSCGETVGTQSCSGGKQCSAGVCRCGPSSQTRCTGNKRYSLDSCGNTVSIIGSC
jgi:hypothetical protein